jgi:hypothetical protein
MEGINDTGNGGETAEGANLRIPNEQLLAMLLPFIERLENRMFKIENRIEENKREILTSLTKDVEYRINQRIESKI